MSGRRARSRYVLQRQLPYGLRITVAARHRKDDPAIVAGPDQAQATEDGFDPRPQPGRGLAERLGQRAEIFGVDTGHYGVDLRAGEGDPAELIGGAIGAAAGGGVENLEGEPAARGRRRE